MNINHSHLCYILPLNSVIIFICDYYHHHYLVILISARCNIYISRLCCDVSVHLSVTFVHCGHRVRWIPDTFACLDRLMSLLLTDNASPRSSDGMMPGFLVEEGGMEKLVIVAISLILLIFYRWTGNT